MRKGMRRWSILLALPLMAAVLALGGCMSKAWKHLYAAQDLFEKRDLKGAQAELQEAIKGDPDLIDAHKLLAQVDEALGDEDGTGQEYDAASRLDPTDTKLLAKVHYYRQLKQTENSIEDATGDIKAGKFEEGLSELKDAIKETRSKEARDQALAGLAKAAPTIAQDGDSLTAQKKYADADKAYDSAIRAYMLMAQARGTSLDSATDKILHSANEAAAAAGTPYSTFKLLNDVLTFEPDNKAAHRELARVYSEAPPEENPEDALAEIERGHYGEMPTAVAVGDTGGGPTVVAIANSTGYWLSVYFVGPRKKTIEIPPKGNKKVPLKAGRYREGARVSNPGVIPFFGVQDYLEGTAYRETFLIEIRQGPSY
jgi:Tfp pilus assembly protein PilF